MSRILEQLIGTGDDFDDDDDDFDQELDYDDDEENCDKKEDKVEGLDLLSLASNNKKKKSLVEDPQKKNAQKKNKKKKKKTENRNEKSHIIVKDIEEKHYFESLIFDKNEKKHMDQYLEKIEFRLNVKEFTKMNYDHVPFKEFIIYSVNESFLKAKLEAMKYVQDTERDAKKTNKMGINTETLIDQYIEKNGSFFNSTGPIKKWRTQITKCDANSNQYHINHLLEHFFKRSYFAMATHGPNIYIHGGTDGKTTFSDLIRFDTSSNIVYMYKDLHVIQYESSCFSFTSQFKHLIIDPLPMTSYHQMVYIHSGLLIFGGDYSPPYNFRRVYPFYGLRSSNQTPSNDEMFLYFVQYPEDINRIQLGIPKTLPYYFSFPKPNAFFHPVKVSGSSNYISKRTGFSATVIGGEIYVFGGGFRNGNGRDDLFIITLDYLNVTYECKVIKKPSNSKVMANNLVWPGPRRGHSATVLNGNLLIFGGHTMNHFYNDLFIFDTSSKIWKEITIDGIIPPSMAFHSTSLPTNQSLFCYGGLHGDIHMNSLYEFDISDKKWYIAKILGHGQTKDSSAKQLQQACSGHELVISSGKMFRIGGNMNGNGHIVLLNEIYSQGTPYLLTNYLSKQKKEGFMCDVIFVTKDTESDSYVQLKAHRSIIHARCSYLAKLIQVEWEKMKNADDEIVSEDLNEEEEEYKQIIVTVHIEHYDSTIFNAYLDYLYTGEININGFNNVKMFSEMVKEWSPNVHYPIIDSICKGSYYMDTADQVLQQLENDLGKLINSDTCSDISLRLPRGRMESIGEEFDAEEYNVVHSHRLILCRSPFFRSMLTSGMQESKQNFVTIQHQASVVLGILKFLYTDQIDISPDNCIGILMYSTMLGLNEVSDHCRNMVSKHINDQNVFQVAEIGEAFSDLIIRRHAIHYIGRKFESLSYLPEYSNLQPSIKREIEDYHNKKMKQSQRKQQKFQLHK